MPRVHNKKAGTAPADAVYIGRPSKWGNPYSHLALPNAIKVADRDAAIDAYESYIRSNPALSLDASKELAGKDLICWCAPKRCHGDVLLRLANGEGG